MNIVLVSVHCFIHLGLGPGQVETGPFFPVEVEEKGYFCEYWISPAFQTCLKLKKSKTKTNIFLLDGRYFERGGNTS